MKCGECDKRNEEYYRTFDVNKYFQQLLIKNDDPQGTGLVILDVGAHEGESAIFFSDIFPGAKIYSFEPNPSAARKLINLHMRDVEVHQLALSDSKGVADFNIQDITHLSSLNPINRNSIHSLGYAARETHTTVKVDVARGDEFVMSHEINKIDLLKIDVQANEINTIRGFSAVLNRIENVFVEVSMYDFYERHSSIREIEESLPGFELYDIYEISKNPKTLGTDWATLVYKNSKANA